MSWITIPSLAAVANVAINALGIYLAVIVCTRTAGLRSFSKMSSFDFPMTIAIGSVIGAAATSAEMPLILAIVSIGMIYALQMTISSLRSYGWVSKLVDNEPLLLVRDGDILEDNLDRSEVSMDDLRAKVRQANALTVEDVEAVVFETTGDISVLHSSDPDETVGEWLLEDVANPER